MCGRVIVSLHSLDIFDRLESTHSQDRPAPPAAGWPHGAGVRPSPVSSLSPLPVTVTVCAHESSDQYATRLTRVRVCTLHTAAHGSRAHRPRCGEGERLHAGGCAAEATPRRGRPLATVRSHHLVDGGHPSLEQLTFPQQQAGLQAAR